MTGLGPTPEELESWYLNMQDFYDKERERRRQEEAARRREQYDAEWERRWKQQQESDDPPQYDPWTGHYL